jgi:large subunit ribosomal protein L17
MKKRKKGRTLSRTKDQRGALLNTQLVSLAKYQSIKTTLAKAKELRPFAERMMNHAKIAVSQTDKKVAKMRFLSKRLPVEGVRRLIQLAELFKERKGGYTRIIKLPNRKSDQSKRAMIEWVEKLEEEKGKKKTSKEEKKLKSK